VNFRPELAAAVMDGRKTVTRRIVSENPRSPWWRGGCAYRVGQSVAVCPGRAKHAIGRAVVRDVRLEPLSMLYREEDAHAEGFPSVAAFRAAWEAINGGQYDPTAIVWRVELEAEAPCV
jgi:hypothetical protein